MSRNHRPRLALVIGIFAALKTKQPPFLRYEQIFWIAGSEVIDIDCTTNVWSTMVSIPIGLTEH